VVREYPRLLTLLILVSLLWAGLAFRWIRTNRRQLRDLAKRADIDGLTGALRRESFSEKPGARDQAGACDRNSALHRCSRSRQLEADQ
jgi:hypothetical protein